MPRRHSVTAEAAAVRLRPHSPNSLFLAPHRGPAAASWCRAGIESPPGMLWVLLFQQGSNNWRGTPMALLHQAGRSSHPGTADSTRCRQGSKHPLSSLCRWCLSRPRRSDLLGTASHSWPPAGSSNLAGRSPAPRHQTGSRSVTDRLSVRQHQRRMWCRQGTQLERRRRRGSSSWLGRTAASWTGAGRRTRPGSGSRQ